MKLARSHRSGDLTAVWIPDEASEALRDLVRAREAAKRDQLRAQHRLTKFLLRTGRRPPLGVKVMDGTSCGVAPAGSLHTSCAGSNVARLSAEVQHMAERVKRLENSIVEVIQLAPASMQEVIRGLRQCAATTHIVAARLRSNWATSPPLRARTGSDGIQRSISGRRLQRQAYSKRRHYQVRQRAPQTNHCRIGLELSTPASGRSQVTQAPGRTASRDHRYCMESTEPSAQTLHGADGARQRTEKDHDGSGTRIVGLHLGHRDQSRSVMQATNGGMTITKEQKQELSK